MRNFCKKDESMYSRDYIGCLFFNGPLKIPYHKHFIKVRLGEGRTAFFAPLVKQNISIIAPHPPSVVFSSRHRYRLKLIFGRPLLSAFDESANLEKAMTGATGCCTNEI